jgi:hypothetical protein
MGSEAALVSQRRLDMVRIWLPRMGERFPDVHLQGQVESGAATGWSRETARVQYTRKEVESAVQWALQLKGKVTIREGGRWVLLKSLGELPSGRVDFVAVAMDGKELGRSLISGELRKLAPLSGVEALRLYDLQVDGADLVFLRDWKHLESVDWVGSNAGPLLAQFLANQTSLRSLLLVESEGITAEFFRELALGVHGLRILQIKNCLVEDTVLEGIEKHPKLESLVLRAEGLTPACVPRLANFRSLKELVVGESLWQPEGPQSLDALSRLKLEHFGSLNPGSEDFEERVLAVKNAFPQLKSLVLEGRSLNVEQAEVLRKNLRTVSGLEFLGILPAPGVAAVLAKMPKLDFLHCRNPKLGDNLAAEFLGMRSLRGLDLAYTAITDASMHAIQKAAEGGLKEINVAHSKFTLAAVQELKHRVPGLKVNYHLQEEH